MGSGYSGGYPGGLPITVLGQADDGLPHVGRTHVRAQDAGRGRGDHAGDAPRISQKIRYPDFQAPAVGSTVRVEYPDKHPDQVELALGGDDRYDIALSNREERKQHKAGQASRDSAFRATLDAAPGNPPDGDQSF